MNPSRAAALLGVALLISAAVACGSGNTVSNGPAPAAGSNGRAPAQAETGKPDYEGWLDQSPATNKMKSQWLDCGLIVSNLADPATADWAVVESAAEDIARKAGGCESFWHALKRATNSCAAAGAADDWAEADRLHGRLTKVCTDCHVENWELSFRGFTPKGVEAWKTGYTNPVEFTDVEAESLTRPPREPFHKGMRKLEDAADALRKGIDAKSWEGMPEHAKAIVGSSDKQIALWGVIAAKARRIQELAEKRDAAAIEPEYKTMIAKCIACHATKVATPRDFINPLPWPE